MTLLDGWGVPLSLGAFLSGENPSRDNILSIPVTKKKGYRNLDLNFYSLYDQ